jgi:acyl-CoA thioester hydrolase
MPSSLRTIEHSFQVMTYDIDFAGVVSNITYIRWLEDLRNLYAERFLSLGEAFQRGIAPALMRTEIDYLAPVRFPATLSGRIWLAEHGRVKFVLAAEFESAAAPTGQVVARARQTGAFVALDTGRPVRLPEEYRTVEGLGK